MKRRCPASPLTQVVSHLDGFGDAVAQFAQPADELVFHVRLTGEERWHDTFQDGELERSIPLDCQPIRGDVGQDTSSSSSMARVYATSIGACASGINILTTGASGLGRLTRKPYPAGRIARVGAFRTPRTNQEHTRRTRERRTPLAPAPHRVAGERGDVARSRRPRAHRPRTAGSQRSF